MREISKRTIFIVTVLLCFITPISMNIQDVQGLQNYSRIPGESVSNEVTKQCFVFRKHYASHDWIFDMAVRLINKDLNLKYRSYINTWLFDPSVFSSWSSIEGNIRGTAWFDDNTELGLRNYRTNYLFSGSDYQKDRQWQFARRYVTALSATKDPDLKYTHSLGHNLKVNGAYLEAEEYSNAALKRTSDHSVGIDDDTHEFIGGQRAPINYVSYLSNLAVSALNHQEPYINKDGEEKWRIGKYEAAAALLGEMAHYFGDLAMPCHVLYGKYQSHTTYEKWIADNFFLGWSQSLNCPYDVIYLDGILSDLKLSSKLTDYHTPLYNIKQMALATYTAYDVDPPTDERPKPDVGDLAAIEFDNPANYPVDYDEETRQEQLIANAVYYLACSILYICKKAATNVRTVPNEDYAFKQQSTTIIEVRDPEPYTGKPPQSDNDNFEYWYQVVEHCIVNGMTTEDIKNIFANSVTGGDNFNPFLHMYDPTKPYDAALNASMGTLAFLFNGMLPILIPFLAVGIFEIRKSIHKEIGDPIAVPSSS